jgi:hypothetical protein
VDASGHGDAGITVNTLRVSVAPDLAMPAAVVLTSAINVVVLT